MNSGQMHLLSSLTSRNGGENLNEQDSVIDLVDTLHQWRIQELLSSGQPWAIEQANGLQFFQNVLPL